MTSTADETCPCRGAQLAPDAIRRTTRKMRGQSLVASFCPQCGNLLRLEPGPGDRPGRDRPG